MHAGRSFANVIELYLESAHSSEKQGQGGDAPGLHVVSTKGHVNVGASPGRLVMANAGGGAGGGGGLGRGGGLGGDGGGLGGGGGLGNVDLEIVPDAAERT